MHSEPVIVSAGNIKKRSYVKVYVDGKRYRLYNGKPLGITCNPNHSKSLKQRDKALQTLQYESKKKLEAGWSPWLNYQAKTCIKAISAAEAIETVQTFIEREDISDLYKRDLKQVGEKFLLFLQAANLENFPVTDIDEKSIVDFLQQFKSSATHYMNQRRNLSAFFSRLDAMKTLKKNLLLSTSLMKQRTSLHKAFRKDQMLDILGKLKERNSCLYVCALLMYGCMLRPHQEIRHLKKGNFSDDLSVITLSGYANKSKRIRVVKVPLYVRNALVDIGLSSIESQTNIFTKQEHPFNESYFNCIWTRIKSAMLKERLLEADHTLYSFRHTAAVNIYMKSKDPYKIQQLFGHGSLTVTLTYLRSLGLVNLLSEDDLPEL